MEIAKSFVKSVLVFTFCHKCIKYDRLPWKLLKHTEKSYISHRKQLYHPLETVMSHRIQIYPPPMHLFCILISSGLRFYTYTVAKQSKQTSWILNRLCFYLEMLHNMYPVFLGNYTRISAPWCVTIETMWYTCNVNHAYINYCIKLSNNPAVEPMSWLTACWSICLFVFWSREDLPTKVFKVSSKIPWLSISV